MQGHEKAARILGESLQEVANGEADRAQRAVENGKAGMATAHLHSAAVLNALSLAYMLAAERMVAALREQASGAGK